MRRDHCNTGHHCLTRLCPSCRRPKCAPGVVLPKFVGGAREPSLDHWPLLCERCTLIARLLGNSRCLSQAHGPAATKAISPFAKTAAPPQCLRLLLLRRGAHQRRSNSVPHHNPTNLVANLAGPISRVRSAAVRPATSFRIHIYALSHLAAATAAATRAVSTRAIVLVAPG